MKIEKQKLLKALTLVADGLDKTERVEQSNHYAFTPTGVFTYNDEVRLYHPIVTPIDGAVRAEELSKVLARINADEITVTTTKTTCTIKARRTEVQLNIQPNKLPLGNVPEAEQWLPVAENLAMGMDMAANSCASDLSRPLLNCVHVSTDGVVVGSDSFKILRYDTGTKVGVDAFLLPARSARLAQRLGVREIALSGGWVHFRTADGTVLSCRTFADEYPAVDSFMKVEGPALTLPNTTAEMLQRMDVFARRQDQLDEEVHVTIADNRITLEAENDAGKIKEQANIKYTDDPIKFIVSPFVLRDILKETRECTIGDRALRFVGSSWEYVTALRV